MEYDPPLSHTHTPLTVETLLKILSTQDVLTVAGYNGTCERVIRLDGLLAALQKMPRDYLVL